MLELNKMKIKVGFITAAIISLTLNMSGSAFAADQKYVTIGTGGQTGVYYVVGQSICKLVNRGQKTR